MKMGRGALGLFFLLWMVLPANAGKTMSNFTRDLIDTFNMNLPTIVYDSGAEAPEICYTRDSVLCLPSERFVVNCDKSEEPESKSKKPCGKCLQHYKPELEAVR